MHEALFEALKLDTLVMQFYGFLSRGKLNDIERNEFAKVEEQSIELLIKQKNPLKSDDGYNIVLQCSQKVIELKEKYRALISKYAQKGSDHEIASYLLKNKDFFSRGISLYELDKLLDVSLLLRNGHFLHDHYLGYYNSYLESFHEDCVDYLNSAFFFYNEGYDFFFKRKDIKIPTPEDVAKLPAVELKRIHTKEEVTPRNFKEAFINLILFVESFINSVGYDAFQKKIATSVRDENFLKGIQEINKNGFPRYSTLRQKFINISRIISGKSTPPIDLDVEPFKTYFDFYVELRNSYVHASPEKGKIWYTIEDWKNKCDELIDNYCYSVIKEFWSSCYPTNPFPNNLFNTYFSASFKGRGSIATPLIT